MIGPTDLFHPKVNPLIYSVSFP